ncbi:peptidylprolyl isomerase [Methanococcoides methylutens]|uniref:Peptidyl-prolyl cis-trans isomerase n=1 Tax=Methanococcoides methylutens TaxID=2226 RepID=A0A099T130_METMT|nr:peptidylprolyl isomerase [Methanococcoides methylutens]KGK98862.1 peptidylprolyl isomerase [Methanococcoides methylutens]
MAIEKGDVIKLSYTGKFNGDQIFDTTNEDLAKENEIYNPRGMYGGDIVIVGAGHTIAGLDADLEGKEVGYSGNVIIPPEGGFGDHDPKLVENMSLTKFKDQKAYPGMNIEIDNKRGTVTKVIGRRVRVDFNHPLAGKEVTYEYTIDEKIEDVTEKVKGILALYTGVPDLEVEVNDNKAAIEVPAMLTFNQRWLMAKGRVANELVEYVGLDKVSYIESYPVETPAPAVEAEEEITESEE